MVSNEGAWMWYKVKKKKNGLTVKAFQTGGLAADLEKKEQDFFLTADQEQTTHRASDEHTLPAWSTGTVQRWITVLTSFYFIQLQKSFSGFDFFFFFFNVLTHLFIDRMMEWIVLLEVMHYLIKITNRNKSTEKKTFRNQPVKGG